MPPVTIAISGNLLKLLDLCLKGDPIARQELAEQISKLIYGYTNKAAFLLKLRLSREDYADINQEVLIKLFANDNRKLRTFRGASRLERWIYVIVYRHMVDHRLRDAEEQKQRKTISIHAPTGSDPDCATLEDSLAAEASDPREVLAYRAMVESLRTACKGVLNDEERTILDLWCSRQYTTDQIAGLMGRNSNTISTLIHRAQAKILEYLREKEPDTVLYR
jgi:RNA polymerase sigma factor (sigma-70 family)